MSARGSDAQGIGFVLSVEERTVAAIEARHRASQPRSKFGLYVPPPEILEARARVRSYLRALSLETKRRVGRIKS